MYGAARAFASGDMDGHLGLMDFSCVGSRHEFNVGNMVFLSKKPCGTHPVFGELYSAGDVRPLVIVNTDNRIIANVYRMQWEPILDSWIS